MCESGRSLPLEERPWLLLLSHLLELSLSLLILSRILAHSGMHPALGRPEAARLAPLPRIPWTSDENDPRIQSHSVPGALSLLVETRLEAQEMWVRGLQGDHHRLHLRVLLGSANVPTSGTWALCSQGRTPYKA